MRFPAPTIRLASRSAALAAAAVLLFGLTACTPNSDAGDDLSTDSWETSIIDWRQKMDDCMLEAGFDLRQGGDGSESTDAIDTSQFDMAEFDKSYASCTDTVGEVPVDPSAPTEDEVFESQLVFAQCMREAGYEFPDPVKGSGMTPSFTSDIDPDVVDACSAEAAEVSAP